MDPVTRRRMRTAHLNQTTDCPCGRTLHGNGWRSHARSCPAWLERYGYPLADGDRAGLRASFSLDQIRQIQTGLATIRRQQLPASGWGWNDYRTHLRAVITELGMDK